GTAVALIDHDQVEEVRGVLPEHILTGRREGLVDAEVHVPRLAGIGTGDLVAGIAEVDEVLVLGVIDQDVAVSQKQDLRAAVLTTAVPAAVPELPAHLEGDAGLA